MKRLIIAAILLANQIGDDLALVIGLASFQVLCHRAIGLDRADAIDARYRGDDDHVIAFQQRSRGGVAHAINLFVDLAFFFNERIAARHIGLWLIIVIIADKILYGISGEKPFEFAIELRRQGFVWCQNQRWALGLFDHFGHGKGFASSGGTKQHLIVLAAIDPLYQFADCGGLIAGGFKLGLKHELFAALKFKVRAQIGGFKHWDGSGHRGKFLWPLQCGVFGALFNPKAANYGVYHAGDGPLGEVSRFLHGLWSQTPCSMD